MQDNVRKNYPNLTMHETNSNRIWYTKNKLLWNTTEKINMSILSQNLNSIGSSRIEDKLKAKLGAVLSQGNDIIMLQDLRLNEGQDNFKKNMLAKAINEIKSPFANNSWLFTNSPKNNRGVCIIIKKQNCILNSNIVHQDLLGNLLILKITFNFGILYLANIYGPNEQNKTFYEHLSKTITNLNDNELGLVIAAGDWNCVMSDLPLNINPDLIDCKSIPNSANGDGLRKLAETNGLYDIYRINNAGTKAYTFKHFSGNRKARSRLDFFLISKLSNDIRKPSFESKILPRLTTLFDHRPVLLKIKKIDRETRIEHQKTKQTIPNMGTITKEGASLIFVHKAVETAHDHLL